MLQQSKEIVCKFFDLLRNSSIPNGDTPSIIKLIFMKFMLGFEQVSEKDDFQIVLQYQKMFMLKQFDPELTARVFGLAEKHFGVPDGLLQKSVLSSFLGLKEYFSKSSENLFNALNFISLPSDSKQMCDLLDTILVYNEGVAGIRAGASEIRSSLLDIVLKILDVKEDDTYLDLFCGFMHSALRIDAKQYSGCEVNSEVLTIAYMILIMAGRQNFSLENKDVYQEDFIEVADKVLADAPFGMDVHFNGNLNQIYGKKSDAYNIIKAVTALRPKGTAVVVSLSGVLFQTTNSMKDLRKNYSSCLKAVIALPPMALYTNVNINLLVFEKDKESKDVMMVNPLNFPDQIQQNRRDVKLKDDLIETIVEAVYGKEIKGLSAKVSIEEISKNDFSWVPMQYVREERTFEYRSVKEIDADIEKVVNQLVKSFSKNV